MLIRKLYQALRPCTLPEVGQKVTPVACFSLERLEDEVAPILGISAAELARRRALATKRRELDDMEQALELGRRERQLRQRAREFETTPSTTR